MNHPYLYPDQAPWTDDYHELIDIRRSKHGQVDPENTPDDENDERFI